MPSTRYLDLDYTDVAGASLDALEAIGFPIVETTTAPARSVPAGCP